MYYHITAIVWAICLIPLWANSQDIHFTQFLFSPLNLNPALTGSFEGDLRAVSNHKSQWQSFANAYSTFSVSVDGNFRSPVIKGSFLGAGLLLNTDKAGDGNFTTNQVKLLGAWHFPLRRDSSLFASVAANGAYTVHGLNINLLNFGNQYSNGQFNPDLPHNELLQSSTLRYFDVSAGVSMRYLRNAGLLYQVGFSLQHINEPVKSFDENSQIRLPRKFVYHASAEWNIKDDLWLDPFVLYMHQEGYMEANLGSMVRIMYNPLGLKYVFGGLAMRALDSGILMMGVNYQDIRLTLSYDVNLSKLSAISRGRGGIELSLVYIYQRPRTFEPSYYRKCPEFM